MVDKPKRRRIGISDRVRIQAALESGLPPSKIAEDTGFSKSAICREITSRSTVKNPTAPRCRPGLYVCSKCTKRAYCRKRKLYYSYRSADADAAAKRRGPRKGLPTRTDRILKLNYASDKIGLFLMRVKLKQEFSCARQANSCGEKSEPKLFRDLVRPRQ
ncbi:MAG: helix-turn-helix domain-containing protein, partial [Firmicutes bacterium]|nr:helix-turn-helix domain-containing protein [Candidatus Enteromonas pullistercoris]